MHDDTPCFYVPDKPGIIDIAAERDGKTVGLHSGETIEQVAVRYPGVQLGKLGEVQAASRAMFRHPPVEITKEQFHKMLDVLPPVGWTNRGHAETFKLSERTYGPITAIFCRLGERYFTLSDDIAMPHDAIVVLVTAVANSLQVSPMNKRLDLIYRHTPPDYRSIIDGEKFILMLREGEGTCLVQLSTLPEKEVANRLPRAVKAEALELGRQAHAAGIAAAPSLDARCMALVNDMNPSGEIGAGFTSIVFEAWSRGWHLANTDDAATDNPDDP
jgi:hypothetical protein